MKITIEEFSSLSLKEEQEKSKPLFLSQFCNNRKNNRSKLLKKFKRKWADQESSSSLLRSTFSWTIPSGNTMPFQRSWTVKISSIMSTQKSKERFNFWRKNRPTLSCPKKSCLMIKSSSKMRSWNRSETPSMKREFQANCKTTGRFPKEEFQSEIWRKRLNKKASTRPSQSKEPKRRSKSKPSETWETKPEWKSKKTKMKKWPSDSSTTNQTSWPKREEERSKRRITNRVKKEKEIDMCTTSDQNIYCQVRPALVPGTEDNSLY